VDREQIWNAIGGESQVSGEGGNHTGFVWCDLLPALKTVQVAGTKDLPWPNTEDFPVATRY